MKFYPGGGGGAGLRLSFKDMGSFWASREWEGVHLYGSVFTGIIAGMGRIFSFMP